MMRVVLHAGSCDWFFTINAILEAKTKHASHKRVYSTYIWTVYKRNKENHNEKGYLSQWYFTNLSQSHIISQAAAFQWGVLLVKHPRNADGLMWH